MVGGVWVGLFLGGGAIYPLLRLLPVGQLAKSFTRKVQRSMLLVYVPVSSTSRVGANVPFPIPKTDHCLRDPVSEVWHISHSPFCDFCILVIC